MVETVGALILASVGIIDFTLFTIGAVSVTLSAVVGTAAIIAANVALAYLTAPRPGASPGFAQSALPQPDAHHLPLRQAISPRVSAYGTNRIAGYYLLYEAVNGVSYDILALHWGKLSQIRGYYLHDDTVTLGATGIVDIQGDGRYGANALTIKTRVGEVPSSTYTEVTSAISAWTDAHAAHGIATLMLKCNAVPLEDYYEIFPRGLPAPSVLADCLPLFDPRDAAQSRADQTTWTSSTNPVIQLINLLTDSDRGPGFDWDVLIQPNLSELNAQADLCDEVVAKKDSETERRYSSSGIFPLDSDDVDKIQAILATCDGWMAFNSDGSLKLVVGKYTAPSASDVIESKHIKGFSLTYNATDEEAVNELTIDYTEPALDYKTAPGQPWRDEDDISARGKVRSQRMALPWVQSHSQARRLAKRRMAQINARLRGTITTNLYGLKFLSERWVRVDAPERIADLSDLVVEVLGASIDLMNAQVTYRFAVIDPNGIDAWSPVDEEGASPEIPAKLIAIAPPVPTGLAATSADGSYVLHVQFDNPNRADLQYQMEWRLNGSGNPFTIGTKKQASFNSNPAKLSLHDGSISDGITIGLSYDVAIRSFAPSGSGSAFTSTIVIVAVSGG